jgi:hypothetical protein
MSPDTRSTVIGLAVAILISVGTYLQTADDISNPIFWVGLAGAIVAAVKGYYHNKPQPPQPPEAK